MATQTKNQSDYSTRGNAEHTENTARDERRAMAWTPQEEVAYAKEEKQLRTEARFDRFLQNFEKAPQPTTRQGTSCSTATASPTSTATSTSH